MFLNKLFYNFSKAYMGRFKEISQNYLFLFVSFYLENNIILPSGHLMYLFICFSPKTNNFAQSQMIIDGSRTSSVFFF